MTHNSSKEVAVMFLQLCRMGALELQKIRC